ncbi:S41 family peptidase [Catellatospora coxensis]|uniref:Interphotoreceptor retinoid-binding protein n=1 Tax=Catellatospora coxensis TaxID=310354 RepID=A0A8J3KQJ3_9ACTN|nr:S41 family peptidase [Catellatospora coxensis]GIG04297.1 interphotoreceptor retinoid-binding protein [Catellatospora coxensis]
MPKLLVERAMELMCANYVFPERAVPAAADVRRRLTEGEYDGLDEASLADALTLRLAEHCADKHLRVRVRDARLHTTVDPAEADAVYREHLRVTNHGIARVERLDGNVGCIELRGVTAAGLGGRAIAAAMELVSQTEALILDLRRNRGGSPDGAIFWTSYFFPDGETHLNSIESGAGSSLRQYWSVAYLPGERYLDRPVYVLTSDFTFSAGEELSYNLQSQARATLIGETTRGGAHPTERFPITPTLEITVPVARSINPITGTNWEGTGVIPDIPVPAAQAFPHAYRLALDHVLSTTTSPATRDEATTATALLLG